MLIFPDALKIISPKGGNMLTINKSIIFCAVVMLVFVFAVSVAEVYALSAVEISGDLTLNGGSVVFPDGTAQTTASKPTWNQKISGAARWLAALDDAAVLDKETGLVWQRQTSGLTSVQEDAISYCTILSLGGRLGWRLPTVEELATLIDPGAGGAPYLPAGHLFTDAPAILAGIYWSSTTSASDSTRAWLAYFSNGGSVATIYKSNAYYFRCVRGGQ